MYELRKGLAKRGSDVVVRHGYSAQLRVHKETDGKGGGTHVSQVVVVQVDLCDVMDVGKHHSQGLCLLILKLEVAEAQLVVVWVIVVVEVDELDGRGFALVAVVLEDVLDQLC